MVDLSSDFLDREVLQFLVDFLLSHVVHMDVFLSGGWLRVGDGADLPHFLSTLLQVVVFLDPNRSTFRNSTVLL